MNETDFSICRFIKNELCFVTYYEFCKNARVLKYHYEELDNDGKTFYKWYVYANIFMDEIHKNTIWNYLNNSESEYYEILIQRIEKKNKK